MKEFFDIASKWDHFGQGLFFLIVIMSAISAFAFIFKMLAVMVRGWPPPECVQNDEEEEE